MFELYGHTIFGVVIIGITYFRSVFMGGRVAKEAPVLTPKIVDDFFTKFAHAL